MNWPGEGCSPSLRPRTQCAGWSPYFLTAGLGAAEALAAALTVVFPDVIMGPVGTDGNTRGTALAVLCGPVPSERPLNSGVRVVRLLGVYLAVMARHLRR